MNAWTQNIAGQIFSAILFCVVFLTPSSAGPTWDLASTQIYVPEIQKDRIDEEIDWSRNTSFIALDIEKELNKDYILIDLNKGFITMKDTYLFLYRLFGKVQQAITVKDRYTEKEALETARIIHNILHEEGFEYRNFSSNEYHLMGGNLFSYGLMRKQVYCLTYMLLYLGIAERLGLPIVGINVPEHLALRWNLSYGKHVNWEATVPDTYDDESYIYWKNISEVAVKNGVYLRSLSKKEVIAHVYYNISLVLTERHELKEAIHSLNKATELFPKYSDAYNYKGAIWRIIGEIDKAIENCDMAIGLDPKFPEAYYNRARAKLEIGDYAGMNKDLAQLRALDPTLARQLEYVLRERRVH